MVRTSWAEQKLFKGIALACNKRPVSEEQINNIVSQVEDELQNSSRGTEVTSKKIGELVMDRLKSLDEVAYVRFASVYRSFEDVRAFLDEIERLENELPPELRKSQLNLLPVEGVKQGEKN